MVQFQFRDCTKLTSSRDWAATTRPHLGHWVRSPVVKHAGQTLLSRRSLH